MQRQTVGLLDLVIDIAIVSNRQSTFHHVHPTDEANRIPCGGLCYGIRWRKSSKRKAGRKEIDRHRLRSSGKTHECEPDWLSTNVLHRRLEASSVFFCRCRCRRNGRRCQLSSSIIKSSGSQSFVWFVCLFVCLFVFHSNVAKVIVFYNHIFVPGTEPVPL